MNSRRTTLKVLATAPVLRAQHRHEPAAERGKEPPPVPRFFTAQELELLAVLTDLILPRTGTPGAADAGVPMLMDRLANRRPAFGKDVRDGLKLFAGGLPAAELLAKISRESGTRGRRFFDLLKSSTIDLYYTTRPGLVTELGWHGNTYLAEFKGCTHPEHQG